MDKYYHERVTLKHQIPAMIAVLDQDEIEKQFPYGAFIPMHWHRSLEISLLENAEVVLQIGEKEYFIDNDFTCVNSGTLDVYKRQIVLF